jgi:hypothetical protein
MQQVPIFGEDSDSQAPYKYPQVRATNVPFETVVNTGRESHQVTANEVNIQLVIIRRLVRRDIPQKYGQSETPMYMHL